MGQLARRYHMYVDLPHSRAGGPRQYNTAVLLDRQGKVVGTLSQDVRLLGREREPWRGGVGVFDTDFGRIAMLTCFDANFDEVWQEAERKGAEIVFCPAPTAAACLLNGYAMIHNYYVVAVGWGNLIDPLGSHDRAGGKTAPPAVPRHARSRSDDHPHELQREEGPATLEGARRARWN